MTAGQALLQIISSFYAQFNLLDFLIIFIFLFYLVEGYAVGFLSSLVDFASFLFSFLLSIKYYSLIAPLLVKFLPLSVGFSNALGFMFTAFVLEFFISFILKKFLIVPILKRFASSGSVLPLNNILGIFPAFFSCLILITFFLTLIVSLPLSPTLKNYIFKSKIGSSVIANSQGFEKSLNNIFGGAVSDTLNFITVEPKGNESVNLNFKTNSFKTDKENEQTMLAMVNKEREKTGRGELAFDESLAEVGRAHCEDMFRRGYFSHYTPEGFSPFDRMDKAGISYSFAGENLALAPNVATAMQGLMQSPGHRENILSPNFGKVGIGVIDGGIYGEMFCQEFTD